MDTKPISPCSVCGQHQDGLCHDGEVAPAAATPSDTPDSPSTPRPLTEAEVQTLMDLAERLYNSEQHNSGMVTPIPYAYIEGEGKFLIISNWAKDSAEIKELLSERYGHAR